MKFLELTEPLSKDFLHRSRCSSYCVLTWFGLSTRTSRKLSQQRTILATTWIVFFWFSELNELTKTCTSAGKQLSLGVAGGQEQHFPSTGDILHKYFKARYMNIYMYMYISFAAPNNNILFQSFFRENYMVNSTDVLNTIFGQYNI